MGSAILLCQQSAAGDGRAVWRNRHGGSCLFFPLM
jgi:hypothetical protein